MIIETMAIAINPNVILRLTNNIYIMNTISCPTCGLENAYFEILDENGAHYTCPDCDYEWCDPSVKPEAENMEDSLYDEE